MAKKRSKPARKRARPAQASTRVSPPVPRALQYKVVELSTVDESSIEQAINEWVARGWAFDGVQFAMRESSKRPSMGFVFFTREGAPLVDAETEFDPPLVDIDDAPAATPHAERFTRDVVNPVTTSVHDAWARLRELAEDDGSDS